MRNAIRVPRRAIGARVERCACEIGFAHFGREPGVAVPVTSDPPDREGRGTNDESFTVLAMSLTWVDLGRSMWDKPDIDSTPNPKKGT